MQDMALKKVRQTIEENNKNRGKSSYEVVCFVKK